jgi:hypothetical protein
MPESNGNNLENRTTHEMEFQEYVKKQFELLFTRMDQLDGKIDSVGAEMIERFIQLSRQIRDLDIKVDVYTREHSYMKDDIRELRAKMNLQ